MQGLLTELANPIFDRVPKLRVPFRSIIGLRPQTSRLLPMSVCLMYRHVCTSAMVSHTCLDHGKAKDVMIDGHCQTAPNSLENVWITQTTKDRGRLPVLAGAGACCKGRMDDGDVLQGFWQSAKCLRASERGLWPAALDNRASRL